MTASFSTGCGARLACSFYTQGWVSHCLVTELLSPPDRAYLEDGGGFVFSSEEIPKSAGAEYLSCMSF